MRTTKIVSTFLLFIAFAATAGAQDHSMKDCPMKASDCPMKEHADHAAAVDSRGDHAMGFSHEKTTHHFLVRRDGGSIDISADDTADTASATAIRQHLSHIAKKFAAGDFDVPMFIHDTVPPGVDAMKRLRSEVHYRFEETAGGARLVITSGNAVAIDAIQKFLRFQIEEHRTGDPGTVQP
jgi:hypothetical protein